MLRELQARVAAASQDYVEFARELVSEMKDGRAKLFVTWRALTCRREHPGLFTVGRYIPLRFAGACREHAFGFLREWRGQWAMIVLPRLMCGMVAPQSLPLGEQVWGDTRVLLPLEAAGLRFRNEITGGEIAPAVRESGDPVIRLGDLLRDFSVALLISLR
jgi:(1->4)-alpha-D-glucan 1-alpha-D-glucosylmutase